MPPTPHGKLPEPVVPNWGVWVLQSLLHLAVAPQLTAPPRRPPHRGVSFACSPFLSPSPELSSLIGEKPSCFLFQLYIISCRQTSHQGSGSGIIRHSERFNSKIFVRITEKRPCFYRSWCKPEATGSHLVESKWNQWERIRGERKSESYSYLLSSWKTVELGFCSLKTAREKKDLWTAEC